MTVGGDLAPLLFYAIVYFRIPTVIETIDPFLAIIRMPHCHYQAENMAIKLLTPSSNKK